MKTLSLILIHVSALALALPLEAEAQPATSIDGGAACPVPEPPTCPEVKLPACPVCPPDLTAQLTQCSETVQKLAADKKAAQDAAKQLGLGLEQAKADLDKKTAELNTANQALATAKKERAEKSSEARWLAARASEYQALVEEEKKKAKPDRDEIARLRREADDAKEKAKAAQSEADRLNDSVEDLEASTLSLQQQLVDTIKPSDDLTKQAEALKTSATTDSGAVVVIAVVIAIFMIGLLGVILLLVRDGLKASRAEDDRKAKHKPAIDSVEGTTLSTEYKEYLGPTQRRLEVPHVRAIEEWIRHAALAKTVRKLTWVALAVAFLECIGLGVALVYQALEGGLTQASLELLQKSLLWTLLGTAVAPVGVLLTAYNVIQNKAVAAMKLLITDLGLITRVEPPRAADADGEAGRG